MVGLQPGHIVIIVLIAILFFAPTRITHLVRGFKGMFTQFRDEAGSKNKDKGATTETPKKPKS